MEDILAVYARPLDPARPLVCIDEAGKDLKAHVRPPQPAVPGREAREDSEYDRAGSRNLFLSYAPHLGQRHIPVTRQRTFIDFAAFLQQVADVQDPEATLIVLVIDNRNTHTPAARYEAFPPEEAWRLCQRFEWHDTPCHGSWLNMAELEWSALARQCLDQRLPDEATLEAAVTAWVDARNAAAITATWHLTKEEARQRLHWLYPHPQ